MPADPSLLALGCAMASILFSLLFCVLYWKGLGAVLLDCGPREKQRCQRCGRGTVERTA